MSSIWQSPDLVVNIARATLPRIDLDPASTAQANLRIGAARFHTEETNGMTAQWVRGDVMLADIENAAIYAFINPPGGAHKTKDLVAAGSLPFAPRQAHESMPGLFWFRLMRYRQIGLVHGAIFVCFSLEPLQLTQTLPELEPGIACPSVGDFMVCYPKNRVRYIDPATGALGDQPTHASAIVYVHGRKFHGDEFLAACEGVGNVMIGHEAVDHFIDRNYCRVCG